MLASSAECSEIEERLFLCGRISQYRALGYRRFLNCMFRNFHHFFVLIVFSSPPPPPPPPPSLALMYLIINFFVETVCINESFMFVLFVQVFACYYRMFCDCLTSRQIILSLKIKKLLYVMQTFEDTIYQFVACKNCVLFAYNSDNQKMKLS